jgi:hypothetical protein
MTLNAVRNILLVTAGTFTYTYNTATPAGIDDPREADDRMREIKAALQERLNVNHYFTPSATNVYDHSDTGMHTFIDFQAPRSADPTTIDESQAQIYTLDVSSKAELKWIDEDENNLQITDAGTLNITSSDLLGTLANAAYFTAVDAAGTGTVNLIKADSNDMAVVPDNAQTATNAAPTSTTGIANKKYVDDKITDNTTMVPAVSGAGTGYGCEESVTLQNGLIVKMGYKSGEGAVTFGTAFPNGIVSVVATRVGTQHEHGTCSVKTVSVTGFTIDHFNLGTGTYWIAIGY